jgi:hypothetical protein
VNQGHRTLGFHLTGYGTSTSDRKIMKKNQKDTVKQSSAAACNGEKVPWRTIPITWQAYHMARQRHHLLTKSEEIQRPVVNAILPKMGINRNTARTVVFGTSKYGGLGLDHLSAVQGFAQLQYLIGSLRTQDTTGDLYQMLLEYTQLECGTDTTILEADFTMYEPAILAKNWITECWRYMSLCKSTVAITGIWAPTKARQGDTALMDEFLKQDMTDLQLKDVNRCRIYLQVFHVSDITDLAGNTIEEWAKQGKRQSNRTSKWDCSVQQRPPAGAWKNWVIALQGIATDSDDLYRCLGPWAASLLMHQTTEWNLDATTLSLFRHHEGVWTKHCATKYGRIRFELTGTTTEAPLHITHKADGIQRRRHIELTNVYRVTDCAYEGDHDPDDSIYTSSIGECFHALPKHVRILVGNIPELDLPAAFDCTEPTDLVIATDRSVLFGVGYHSWLIATKKEQVILRGGRYRQRLTNLYDFESVRTRRYLCRSRGDRGLSKIRQNKPTVGKNGL